MDKSNQSKSEFLSIINNWQEYYSNPDEGLGTTYERFILHRYFEKLLASYKISSVLEVPSFGMTGVSGINSLWWSAKGIKTTVVDNHETRIDFTNEVWNSLNLDVKIDFIPEFDHLPYEDNSHELTWNFASLWFVADLKRFIDEIARVSRKVIFICVPNTHGIGYKLRLATNNKIPESLYIKNVNPKSFVNPILSKGWILADSGYLDIPPWPDIAMKKEALFKKLGLGFLINKMENDSLERTSIVDYFSNVRPELDKEILKYDFLENTPFPIKQLWGHHRFFVFINSLNSY